MAKALITGGSSGIGLELARIFAKNGFDLILVARKKDELDSASAALSLHKARITAISMDLSSPDAAQALFKTLKDEDIDVLVNNAGFGLYGRFQDAELEAQVQMMELNMVTLSKLTRLFLPGMIKRKSGKILNLASTAAFQPGPFMAVYYASKAYVLSFSEALASELEGSGVSVTALCPGPTETAFMKRSGLGSAKIAQRRMDPARVAREGYDGLMKGKAVVIPGFRNRFSALLVRLLPRHTVVRYVRRMQERRSA